MLFYTEICLSHLEVPGERNLCIYISGCQNNCSDCHYPELKRNYYGDILKINYIDILDLYNFQTTCVCFMGEGKCSEQEKLEFQKYCSIAHSRNLKTCLYSGRDIDIEEWMQCFDYIKLGSYKAEFGALDSPDTNQRMYKKTTAGYEDITNMFWTYGEV